MYALLLQVKDFVSDMFARRRLVSIVGLGFITLVMPFLLPVLVAMPAGLAIVASAYYLHRRRQIGAWPLQAAQFVGSLIVGIPATWTLMDEFGGDTSAFSVLGWALALALAMVLVSRLIALRGILQMRRSL